MVRHETLSILTMLVLFGTAKTLETHASAVPGSAQPSQQLVESQADLLAECERQEHSDVGQDSGSQEICARARFAQALLLGERDLSSALVNELATGSHQPIVRYGHRDTRSPLSRGVNGMSRGQSEAFNRLLMSGLEGGPFEAGPEFSVSADGGGSGDKPLWASAMGGDQVNVMGSRWQPMRGKRAERRPLFSARRSASL